LLRQVDGALSQKPHERSFGLSLLEATVPRAQRKQDGEAERPDTASHWSKTRALAAAWANTLNRNKLTPIVISVNVMLVDILLH
jgi:hypothetical protein